MLQNLLLISEFLWPALLLPVAGNKVTCSAFELLSEKEQKTAEAIWFSLLHVSCLFFLLSPINQAIVICYTDLQRARHIENATWTWDCTVHRAWTSEWCRNSYSSIGSHILDRFTGINLNKMFPNSKYMQSHCWHCTKWNIVLVVTWKVSRESFFCFFWCNRWSICITLSASMLFNLHLILINNLPWKPLSPRAGLSEGDVTYSLATEIMFWSDKMAGLSLCDVLIIEKNLVKFFISLLLGSSNSKLNWIFYGWPCKNVY